LRQTLAFARDPCGTLQRYARRYGDPFTLTLFTGPLVLTGTPEGIQEIFTAPPQTFTSNIRLAESAPATPVPRTFTLGPKGGVRMSYEGGLDG
jgi:hypothetical protein